jgi:RHS repeat-associated protein
MEGLLHQVLGGIEDYGPTLDQYQATFRRYGPTLSRWFTPDPLGGDLTNPQSLNRYAYVLNNPTTLTDPLGLQPDGFDGGDCSDPAFADGNAECQSPGSPFCIGIGEQWNPFCGGEFPIGGGGGGAPRPGTGAGGGVTTTALPPGWLSGPGIGAPSTFLSSATIIAGIGEATPFEIEITVVCATDPVCLGVLLGAGGIAIAAHEGTLGTALKILLPLPIQAATILQMGKAQSNEWTDMARQASPKNPCGWLAVQKQLPQNQGSATQLKIVQAEKFLGCRNVSKRIP